MTKPTILPVENPVYTHVFPVSFTMGKTEVDELPIRAPTGLDLMQVGTPVLYDSDTGKADLDIPRCYAMTSRLSNIPENVLYRIDTAEMLNLFWLIASFFMRGRQMLLPALEKQKAELSETEE